MSLILRAVVIALLQVYRYAISPFLPASCRFTPTCSGYALECVRRFGVLRGGWLSVRRLLRCHPWGASGYDPVPDRPAGCRSDHPVLGLLHPTDRADRAGDGKIGTRA